MHEDLVVALRHTHRREDGAGRVRAHQQIDLVDRDQSLVEAPGDLGLGLIVEKDPFDGPAEQSAAPIHLVDVDLAGDLVQERCRGERAGQCERPSDPHGRARWRGGACAGEADGEDDRDRDHESTILTHDDLQPESPGHAATSARSRLPPQVRFPWPPVIFLPAAVDARRVRIRDIHMRHRNPPPTPNAFAPVAAACLRELR